MSQWYKIYEFDISYPGSIDLSAFFNTPGVANTFRDNQSWRLQESSPSNFYTFGTGTVAEDGSLDPGSFPTTFNNPAGYPIHVELQVEYEPEPTDQCEPCNEPTGLKSCPAGVTSGDSGTVELFSGRFQHSIPLIALSALGSGGWSFSLDYYSNFGLDGILGKNFGFPQYAYLLELATVGGLNNVELVTNSNTREIFVDQGGGSYSSDGNNTAATLKRINIGTSNEEFILTASNGTVTRFFGFDDSITTPGRMKSITDRYGNSTSFTWTVTGDIPQVLTATDSYSRTVNYQYYGSEKNYRVREIEDFLGRKLNFQYDDDDRLIAVITPSILRAAEGNTFPGGTAYVFEYDVDNTEPERRDDLIRIWYPNQTLPYLNTATRTVDVEAVYTNATPRYIVEYGQDDNDLDTWGRVIEETIGDPSSGIGGTFLYEYEPVPSGQETNLIDPGNNLTQRRTMYDRNGNKTVYDFIDAGVVARKEVVTNRQKIRLPGQPTNISYITWTKYNAQNQPVEIVFPEGNTMEYEYESGSVSGISGTYVKRRGLLLRETAKPGNTLSLPSRSGSSGQTELTRRFFCDPIFNQQSTVIERRGNPIAASSTYFPPQNGGTTPTDSDRSRYATIMYRDYQKDEEATITGDADLQSMLALTSTEIGSLIAHVDGQMTSGGLPAGFEVALGDVNGDGTGDGASSGLPAAKHLGNTVKIKHPSVRLIGASSITTQVREEIFTVNDRGQITTQTDPEGNLTVYVRYALSDPEGDGQFVGTDFGALSGKQYGRLREVHVDADPADVLSLVGADGDLVDFISGKITRTNTPGVYQNLITRYEGGSSGGGCSTCAYDPLGNPLAMTDPRGFTTRYDRSELGEVFRKTAPAPYLFRVEMHYDANRNVVRVDTEDKQVQFISDDPTSACFGQFVPSGSGSTAHVPMRPGPGGSIRSGWFTNLIEYDLLDNKIEDDIDATGSNPSSLVTRYSFDPNQNLVKITKPEGNTVEYDYDERNLRIAERVGNAPDDPAITITAYDGNGNAIQIIGPSQRGASGNHQTATITDAFDSGSTLVHTGDFVLENVYDGFDRAISVIDAVGNVINTNGPNLSGACRDPDGRVIRTSSQGPVGGATPTNRNGTNNQDLARTINRFDEAGRQYEVQQDVFVASTTTLPSGNRTVDHIGGGLEANSTANSHTGTTQIVNSSGQATSNSSYVLMRTVHDRANRVVTVLQDNTTQSNHTYDGVNRRIREVDALANQVDYVYDPAGNMTGVTRTEKCTITQPTVADEIFRSVMRYDALNRLVLHLSQGADGTLEEELLPCDSDAIWQVPTEALFVRFGYDSRNNPVIIVNPKENTFIASYNGASRVIQMIQHLRLDGEGDNPPTVGQTLLPGGGASIVTTTFFDGNGRITMLVDDRGNSTTFGYDSLDRQTAMIFHDGSTRDNEYDEAGDVIICTDENGSEFANTFDSLGRKTAVAITPASGVVGTTAQSLEYDGLSRMTFARDSVSSTHTDVSLRYDSLSRMLEESQVYAGGAARNVTHQQFVSWPATRFNFPTTRQISSTYDALYRRTLVEETSGGADIAAWQFFGSMRVAEVALGNGLICTYMNNIRTRSAVQAGQSSPSWGNAFSDRLGYDGAGRPITKRFLAEGIDPETHDYLDTTPVVGFTTAYDPAGNKFYERALHAESRSHLYQPFSAGTPAGGYDSADRLRQYQRGTLASTGGSGNEGGGSVTTPIALPNAKKSAQYDLDGLGNWRRFATDPVGGSATTQIRQHNGLNQITRTTVSSTDTNFSYDGQPGASNGNLTDDGLQLYKWDALNRLKEVRRKSDNAVIGQYDYDILNRRVRKIISNGGLSGTIGNRTELHSYSGWRCVEEDWAGPKAQYVWGNYLDEIVQVTYSILGSFYPLQDLLYRTTALTGSSGEIVRAFDYDAYGNTLIFNTAGTGGNWWANDGAQIKDNFVCPFLFTGQRYDPESEIYYYKRRYYHPALGRFIGRDPILYDAGDPNVFRYVFNNPAKATDPLGYVGCCEEEDKKLDEIIDTLEKDEQIIAIIEELRKIVDNIEVPELPGKGEPPPRKPPPGEPKPKPPKPDGKTPKLPQGKPHVTLRDLLCGPAGDVVQSFVDALQQFNPDSNCGKWYKDTWLALLDAAGKGPAGKCDDSKCASIGTVNPPTGSSRADKCYWDIHGTGGIAGASANAFVEFSQAIARKCKELYKACIAAQKGKGKQ